MYTGQKQLAPQLGGTKGFDRRRTRRGTMRFRAFEQQLVTASLNVVGQAPARHALTRLEHVALRKQCPTNCDRLAD